MGAALIGADIIPRPLAGPRAGSAPWFRDRVEFINIRRLSLERGADAAMTAEQVAELIRAGLPQAEVRVASEDDTHFEAQIISSTFEGKRSLARHQLVYATLGDRMGREIHALSIKAYTPEEWRASGARAPR
jgi:acid stress-induced BolA-like protein IbaG/YrbA